MKLITFAVLALSALLLPGCIVGEIRDNLKLTNERLDQTNTRLIAIEDGLRRVDTTNASLASVDDRTKTLQPIEVSLTHLDEHLASLRKTISKLDGAIPFFDFGDSAPVSTPASPPATTPETAGSAPAAAPATPAPRDPIAGPWLAAFPQRNHALVLKDDGTYILSVPTSPNLVAQDAIERGTWKREGSALVFSPSPRPTPALNGVTATLGSTRPEIVSQSTRNLTLALGDTCWIYARP